MVTEKNSKISDGKTDGQINGQTLMISWDPTFMGVQKWIVDQEKGF